jgi:hypothetical protein
MGHLFYRKFVGTTINAARSSTGVDLQWGGKKCQTIDPICVSAMSTGPNASLPRFLCPLRESPLTNERLFSASRSWNSVRMQQLFGRAFRRVVLQRITICAVIGRPACRNHAVLTSLISHPSLQGPDKSPLEGVEVYEHHWTKNQNSKGAKPRKSVT